ncbi:helix-turn-helix domain-containing protein [Pseudomonas juntendi]|uniref:Helix-turn-helix domain-containing protein n=1 Tax=Pseudomonas juntendi TaxID=2666183 RepID=A0ABD4YAC8_9PSED|nr:MULTISPECIES: helix-turn-helix domain-containing protein [Pseudomonas]MDH0756164.1 helix-turn-helix domain-containing protein [Pseudomonas juntendi]MDH1919848.1 helix-turn-helix domain-containing protein [Pseudomonas juntendi]RRV55377.1 helix-turn-helix domain-containing protein [Pseudomonas sp. p99-361]SUD79743.1 DNA-binding transcriptional activator FeaR [Pseudomonas putida]
MFTSSASQAMSSNIDSFIHKITELCGRYQMQHSASTKTLQWSVEQPHAREGSSCTRVINNCSLMRRSDTDSRIDDHDYYFLVLQVAGSSVMEQDGAQAVLNSGDLTLIDSSRSSCFRFDVSSSLSDQLSLILQRNQVEKILGGQQLAVARAIRGPYSSGLAAVMNELYLNHIPSEEHASALIDAVISMLRPEVCLDLPCSSHGDSLRSVNEKLLRKAKAVIEKQLLDPSLTPSIVADQVGTSVRNLHRLFAKHNITPARYIIESRLLKSADRLVEKGDLAISNIALDSGFIDLSHFSRVFKAYFGETPREFRKKRVLS